LKNFGPLRHDAGPRVHILGVLIRPGDAAPRVRQNAIKRPLVEMVGKVGDERASERGRSSASTMLHGLTEI
jgi:hypothetical protein